MRLSTKSPTLNLLLLLFTHRTMFLSKYHIYRNPVLRYFSFSNPRPTPIMKCSGQLEAKLPPDFGEPEQLIQDFNSAINMTSDELEAWLETPTSTEMVFKSSDNTPERDGRHFCRRIVELLGKIKEDPRSSEGEGELLYEADLEDMYRISNYVKCHKEELQDKECDEERKAHLKNFGFDCDKVVKSSGDGGQV
jgi:hypothetical protein